MAPEGTKTRLEEALLLRVAEQQTVIREDVARIASGIEDFSRRQIEQEVRIREHSRKLAMGQGGLALLAIVATLVGLIAGLDKLFS